MAITKVWAIRDRLDKRVNYIVNEKKTALDAGVTYITNPEKTEQYFFTATLNCDNASSATEVFNRMQNTKKRWGKTGGVQGYHFVQSFAPGEVTPEQAHQLGLEFATRVFGSEYEVILGTHLDKKHLHNHIIINSVSYMTGKRYHSSPMSYYNTIRGTSDQLCREHDLSVPVPRGKGMHYAVWRSEKNGTPSVRSMIREDIDSVLKDAYTFQSFVMLMQQRGYVVDLNPRRKYHTVRPPGSTRSFRLDNLGHGYSEQDIRERIVQQRKTGWARYNMKGVSLPMTHYRYVGRFSYARKKKITGFYALYLRYVYLLRGVKRKPVPRLSFEIRKEVFRLEQYEKQFQYLHTTGISTADQLEENIRGLEADVKKLCSERKPKYQKRKRASDEQTRARIDLEIEWYTAALREKRKELRLCYNIRKAVPIVQQQVKQAQDEQRNKRNRKEEIHERKRRDSRFGSTGEHSDHREQREADGTGREESCSTGLGTGQR